MTSPYPSGLVLFGRSKQKESRTTPCIPKNIQLDQKLRKPCCTKTARILRSGRLPYARSNTIFPSPTQSLKKRPTGKPTFSFDLLIPLKGWITCLRTSICRARPCFAWFRLSFRQAKTMVCRHSSKSTPKPLPWNTDSSVTAMQC